MLINLKQLHAAGTYHSTAPGMENRDRAHSLLFFFYPQVHDHTQNPPQASFTTWNSQIKKEDKL